MSQKSRLLAGLGAVAAAGVFLLARNATAKNAGAKGGAAPLGTVAHVDLGRYAGTWYEIASFPQSFQRGCTATTATYAASPDGTISVTNACRLGTPDGREKIARGKARVVDKESNAKLAVSFFPFVWARHLRRHPRAPHRARLRRHAAREDRAAEVTASTTT